jgi:hypothetical protein
LKKDLFEITIQDGFFQVDQFDLVCGDDDFLCHGSGFKGG